MSTKTPADDSREGEIQGEGDYVAGRRFQDAEHAFAEKGGIEEKAREAADALDGPEGDDLEAARIATGEGDTHAHAGHAGESHGDDAHAERRRDRTLEDTFPASDPPSTSPGAD